MSAGAGHRRSPEETAGERIHTAYGIAGARGEAALGFPSALTIGLPALKERLSQGFSLNGGSCRRKKRSRGAPCRADPGILHRKNSRPGPVLYQKESESRRLRRSPGRQPDDLLFRGKRDDRLGSSVFP